MVTIDDVRSRIVQRDTALEDLFLGSVERLLQHLVDQRCRPRLRTEVRPDVIDQAVIMQAARLYRRRYSVSGYEGFGDLGFARVTTVDADIDDLLAMYLRYAFA